MDKILFTGGSSFVISGEWKSGDPFGGSTLITAVASFHPKSQVAAHTCAVTLESDRTFTIYASASATATWPKGVHTLTLTRSEANFFPNGDPLVEVAIAYIEVV